MRMGRKKNAERIRNNKEKRIGNSREQREEEKEASDSEW